MAAIAFKVNMPTDAELDRLFATIPVLNKYQVTDKAVRAATKPIVARARENAPRSSQTGTKKKWSKKMKERRRENEKPLWKTVGATVKKYDTGSFAAVGPAWPEGNKVFYNSAHLKGGRVEVQWGRRTGRVIQQQDNWIKRSSDETKQQQLDAMKASIKKSLDEMMPRG